MGLQQVYETHNYLTTYHLSIKILGMY